MRSVKVAASTLAISAAGLLGIIAHEGVRYVAYKDIAGIYTICVGSTSSVYAGMRASKAECERRLRTDIKYAESFVQKCTKVPVTQGQYDALASFVFNVGGSAYCGSTLVKQLNAGNCQAAANQFTRWSYAGGKYSDGLHNRRVAEAALFRKDC